MAQETVEAPITGTIINVNVKEGDTVNEGDVLCVLESMKMENPIVSPVNGKVAAIKVTAGQVVKTGDQVAIIQY